MYGRTPGGRINGASGAGNEFRTFVHPVTRIEALVRTAGFQVLRSRRTLVWVVLVCRRRDGA
jgi:hypothetical protein